MTHEMLTPSLLATSFALINWRMGPTVNRDLSPRGYSGRFRSEVAYSSHLLIIRARFLFTAKHEFCQIRPRTW